MCIRSTSYRISFRAGSGATFNTNSRPSARVSAYTALNAPSVSSTWSRSAASGPIPCRSRSSISARLSHRLVRLRIGPRDPSSQVQVGEDAAGGVVAGGTDHAAGRVAAGGPGVEAVQAGGVRHPVGERHGVVHVV